MSKSINRRTVIQCAALAASSVIVSASQAATRKTFRFAIVTDTHLGRRGSQTPAKYWQKAAAEIRDSDCDFVLHLGDLVDKGEEAQYPIYQAGRDLIGKPVHEIPGNHDPEELFRRHVRRQIDTSFDHQGLHFVLFNNAHTDSHDGFISDDQIEWLGEQFADAAKRKLRIFICTHVPIHKNLPPDRAWYVKPKNGQTRFYELVREHRKRIVAIVHGHFHNGLRGWDDRAPIHELCCPSLLYNSDRKLASKNAPGYNLPEFRPGYLRAELAADFLKLDYKPLGKEIEATKLIRFT